MKRLLFCMQLGVVLMGGSAFAYTPIGHEQITKAALRYLAHLDWSASRWLPQDEAARALVENAISHAVVEPDYAPNAWGKVVGYGPVAGMKSGASSISAFSSLFHFINVTRPGIYWDYDGFAYRDHRGLDNDLLLGLPFSSILGDLSTGLSLYRWGFKGTNADWRSLFWGRGNSKRAVFPPAYVPAEIALQRFLAAPIAEQDSQESQFIDFPVITGLFKGVKIHRQYLHDHLKGLPDAIGEFGTALHMAQDMCVPHHTLATLDFCHQEFEETNDVLNCRLEHKRLPYGRYEYGVFSGALDCHELYDPVLVERLLREAPPFQLHNGMSLSERLQKLAIITAHWQWGDPSESVDPIGTVLPDGKVFTGDHCSDIFKEPAVREQVRLQYNLAVAASVAFAEIVVESYETATGHKF